LLCCSWSAFVYPVRLRRKIRMIWRH